MPVPVRVTPPSGPVVLLAELKAHLRVDGDDDDPLITALEAAAVAHLDGYRGILRRCILPQIWAVSFDAAGTYRLPLPDVQAVTASTGTAILSQDALGHSVEISEPCTVAMTCALPDDALDAVCMAIKLLVGHWYQNREAAGEGGTQTAPLAFEALLSPIRWVVP